MQSSGKVLLNFVLALALIVRSGEALKCYECIAVGGGTDECNGDIVVKSGEKHVVECDVQSMTAFHTKLHANRVLNPISSVFGVDAPQTYQQQTKTPMSCVKMQLKVGAESVVLRTCQTAQTETVKPCEVMKEKIKKNHFHEAKVDYCDICEGDKCNGVGANSSTFILALLPLFFSAVAPLLRA